MTMMAGLMTVAGELLLLAVALGCQSWRGLLGAGAAPLTLFLCYGYECARADFFLSIWFPYYRFSFVLLIPAVVSVRMWNILGICLLCTVCSCVSFPVKLQWQDTHGSIKCLDAS